MALFVALSLLPVTGARAAVFVFDFENLDLGETTPASWPSATSAGFTADFASPGFAIFNGTFANLSGNYLSSVAAAPNTLDIVFPSALSDLSVDFFLLDATASLNYTALSGGVGGSVVTSGTISDAAEGLLSFSAAPFDTIVLAPSDATFLLIDNLSVTTETVPEPSSIALFGVGLVGVGLAGVGAAFRGRSCRRA
jgi:hypothetical protein